MSALFVVVATLLAAEPAGFDSPKPMPRKCAESLETPACIKWALLHGGLRERLETLRELQERPAKQTKAYVAELESLSNHWLPEFRTLSQNLLRRAGHVDKKWEEPVCPRPRDLEDWAAVPSRASPQFPEACGDVTPGDEHQAMFTPDRETCIYSTNAGEWGSAITVRRNGKTVWTFQNSRFHPAEIVPARSGFWIIESLRHLSGVGALSFLAKDASGKWRIKRIDEFPSAVKAWRADENSVVLAVESSYLPENPCKEAKSDAVWSLAYSEGEHPTAEIR